MSLHAQIWPQGAYTIVGGGGIRALQSVVVIMATLSIGPNMTFDHLRVSSSFAEQKWNTMAGRDGGAILIIILLLPSDWWRAGEPRWAGAGDII